MTLDHLKTYLFTQIEESFPENALDMETMESIFKSFVGRRFQLFKATFEKINIVRNIKPKDEFIKLYQVANFNKNNNNDQSFTIYTHKATLKIQDLKDEVYLLNTYKINSLEENQKLKNEIELLTKELNTYKEKINSLESLMNELFLKIKDNTAFGGYGLAYYKSIPMFSMVGKFKIDSKGGYASLVTFSDISNAKVDDVIKEARLFGIIKDSDGSKTNHGDTKQATKGSNDVKMCKGVKEGRLIKFGLFLDGNIVTSKKMEIGRFTQNHYRSTYCTLTTNGKSMCKGCTSLQDHLKYRIDRFKNNQTLKKEEVEKFLESHSISFKSEHSIVNDLERLITLESNYLKSCNGRLLSDTIKNMLVIAGGGNVNSLKWSETTKEFAETAYFLGGQKLFDFLRGFPFVNQGGKLVLDPSKCNLFLPGLTTVINRQPLIEFYPNFNSTVPRFQLKKPKKVEAKELCYVLSNLVADTTTMQNHCIMVHGQASPLISTSTNEIIDRGSAESFEKEMKSIYDECSKDAIFIQQKAQKGVNILVGDFETSNVELIEYTMYSLLTGKCYYSLIKPPTTPLTGTEIHHIKDSMVEGKPSFDYFENIIHRMCNEYKTVYFLSHSTHSMDLKILVKQMVNPPKNLVVLDTIPIIKHFLGEPKEKEGDSQIYSAQEQEQEQDITMNDKQQEEEEEDTTINEEQEQDTTMNDIDQEEEEFSTPPKDFAKVKQSRAMNNIIDKFDLYRDDLVLHSTNTDVIYLINILRLCYLNYNELNNTSLSIYSFIFKLIKYQHYKTYKIWTTIFNVSKKIKSNRNKNNQLLLGETQQITSPKKRKQTEIEKVFVRCSCRTDCQVRDVNCQCRKANQPCNDQCLHVKKSNDKQ